MPFPKDVECHVSDQQNGLSVIFIHRQGKLSKAFILPTQEVPDTLAQLQFPEHSPPNQLRRNPKPAQ